MTRRYKDEIHRRELVCDCGSDCGMCSGRMDVLEYHMRRYCDTDDIEATEFGKENAVDD